MSVFTRERERAGKYVWRVNQPHTARVEITGREKARSRGEPDTGCGSSNDLFHFIKIMWEFLQFIYLFVLGSKTVRVPHKYNFCRAVYSQGSYFVHLIRRKIQFLTQKHSRRVPLGGNLRWGDRRCSDVASGLVSLAPGCRTIYSLAWRRPCWINTHYRTGPQMN